MTNILELWEVPQAEEIYMIAGWRQWADAGSTSSGLLAYLIQHTKANPIGRIYPDGFYLFQITGAHDLVRPMVKFNQGYPEALHTPSNEFYYAGSESQGVVYFLGSEPHMNIDRYIASVLAAAKRLKVKRIIGLGGVYGEIPYQKERAITSTYSLLRLKEEVQNLSVALSDYQGGASIGSYLCRRAGEQGVEYVSFYAVVPMYDFSTLSEFNNSIRIENDFTAWLGIMRRINHMLKTNAQSFTAYDLADLEKRSKRLVEVIDAKIAELDQAQPSPGIRAYIDRLAESFEEQTFDPLDAIWEQKLGPLMDRFDSGAAPKAPED